MPQQEVYVPIVGEACALMKLGVVGHGGPGPADGITVGGPNVYRLNKDREIEAVVRTARQQETDPAKRLELVSVEFHDYGDAQIDGESYGLALAIADRLARHPDPTHAPWLPPSGERGRIIATGCLRTDEGGIQVSRVGKFPAKLHCLRSCWDAGTLAPGDVFLYPQQNADDLDPADRQLLAELGKAGLVCRGIDRLSWDHGKPEQEVESPEHPPELASPPKPWWKSRVLLVLFPGISATLAVALSVYLWLMRADSTGAPPGQPTPSEAQSKPAPSMSWPSASETLPPQVSTSVTAAKEGPPTVSINGNGAEDADIAIHYRYGGKDGKRKPLSNGERLPSWEHFSIQLDARRDAYVYLWHFDAHQQVQELLGRARTKQGTGGAYKNLVRAGEHIQLPAPRAYYALDDNTGQEHFHTIVASQPQMGLELQYRQLREQARTRSLPGGQGNGFVDTGQLRRGIEAIYPYEPTTQPAVDSTGSLLQCPPTEQACSQSFVIEHVAGKP